MTENKEVTGPAPVPSATTKAPKSILPSDETVLSTLAMTVCVQWEQDTTLTLKWITCPQFRVLVQDYANQLKDRSKEKETRPQLSKRLHELDKTFNDSIEYVKGYISEEVSKNNASVYFLQFGIQRIGKSYRLPTDRNARVESLRKLLTGIEERGYDARKYGKAYWQPLIMEYSTKLEQLDQMDRNLTGQVATKQNNKEQVKKVLKALVTLLQANYPDTYVSELRKWGFQKEKY